jgi:cytochrome c5
MFTNTTLYRRFYAKALLPVLALVVLLGAGCSEKDTTAQQESMPAQATAPQMAEPATPPPVEESAPPATTETPAAAPAATTQTQTAAVDGQAIYKASCQACHAAGVAGAPKLGDKAAWAPRIAKGNDAMYTSVLKGLNAMPPKGACMSCSEDELRAAVNYMAEQGS